VQCCAALEHVISWTQCRIVMSSAWRYTGHGPDSPFAQCCRGIGFASLSDSVIGATRLDAHKTESRHLAILDWVTEHKPTTWVAVDDLLDIAELGAGHYLITDGTTGLTMRDSERLIQLLGRFE